MTVNFEPVVVGGTSLVIPAIQSLNYVLNVSGWSIDQNGDAQFNDIVLGGPGSGASVQIDSFGNILTFNAYGAQIISIVPSNDLLIVYADTGSAVQGGIAFAFASTAGTDTFGNPYSEGLTLGYVGVPAGTPPAGQIKIYLDGSGNLSALTSGGNTRVIAAV